MKWGPRHCPPPPPAGGGPPPRGGARPPRGQAGALLELAMWALNR